MKSIIDNAQSVQSLHPNADINEFTKERQTPETNFQTYLRAKKTKRISNDVASAAAEDMATAQQEARDATGADNGCTHKLPNQAILSSRNCRANFDSGSSNWRVLAHCVYPYLNPEFIYTDSTHHFKFDFLKSSQHFPSLPPAFPPPSPPNVTRKSSIYTKTELLY